MNKLKILEKAGEFLKNNNLNESMNFRLEIRE
jgi:hypothetical protein